MNCTKSSLAGTVLALALSVVVTNWALAGKDKTPPPPPPVRYTVTYLEPLNGTDWSTCTDMNDRGEIVGWCGNNTDSSRRYFLFLPNPEFSGGQIIEIDDLFPEDPSGATYRIDRVCDINNRSQIALQTRRYVGGVFDALYTLRLTPSETPGEAWEMDIAIGGSFSSVGGVRMMNECGDIVGSWSTNEGTEEEPINVVHTYVWAYGDPGFVDLGTLDQQVFASARLISNPDANGFVTIAGENGFQAGTFLFRYRLGGDPSSPNDLQKWLMSATAGASQQPSGMNLHGHFTGEALIGNARVSKYDAFIYRPENGEFLDLETLGGEDSIGHSINSNDDVVGQSEVKRAPNVPFLYTNGTMWNLTNLIDPDTEGKVPSGLLQGMTINKDRYICGPYMPYDKCRAFLLVPYTPQ